VRRDGQQLVRFRYFTRSNYGFDRLTSMLSQYVIMKLSKLHEISLFEPACIFSVSGRIGENDICHCNTAATGGTMVAVTDSL